MAVPALTRRAFLLMIALLMGVPAALVFGSVEARAEDPEPTKVLLLLDVSGSMNEKISGGGTKFAAAKKALKEVSGALPAGTQVGLRVYGSKIAEPKAQNPKACTDTQLVLPIGPLDQSKMNEAVDSFKAVGETPIAYSLGKAVDDLGTTGKRVLVLISDGEESCAGDPCPTARKLAKSGVDLQFNAIGLSVGSKARQQLQCIADAGDGSYYDASEASELSEAIRKLTQRALRPLQFTGTPVTGTPDEADAPPVTVGQYLDRYDASETKRFYTINRTPGSTVTVSTASIIKPWGLGGIDGWTLELETQSGERCGVSSAGGESRGRVEVVAGGVTSYSPSTSSPSSGPDPCATEPLLLSLSRQSYADDNRIVPVEIRITEEPAITNLASLPAGLIEYDGKAKAVKATGATKPTVGGSSFSNAADLTPGRWTDTVTVGETVLYRVRLEPGQRLRATLDTPAPKSSWSLGDVQTVTADLQVYSWSRVKFTREYAVIQGDDAASLTVASPEVRVRNRELSTMGGGKINAASVAGDYYLVVGLTPGQQDLTGRVMPIRLNVAVDGTASGQPEYAVGTLEPTPAVTPTATSSGSAEPTQDPVAAEGGLPVTGLVVGAGALVAGLVVGALLLARRRSRRS